MSPRLPRERETVQVHTWLDAWITPTSAAGTAIAGPWARRSRANRRSVKARYGVPSTPPQGEQRLVGLDTLADPAEWMIQCLQMVKPPLR